MVVGNCAITTRKDKCEEIIMSSKLEGSIMGTCKEGVVVFGITHCVRGFSIF